MSPKNKDLVYNRYLEHAGSSLIGLVVQIYIVPYDPFEDNKPHTTMRYQFIGTPILQRADFENRLNALDCWNGNAILFSFNFILDGKYPGEEGNPILYVDSY